MKKLVMGFLLMSLVLLSIAAVQARPATAQGTVHIVQPGDTLFSIARRYGVDVSALARANNILNPNHIYVGQRLVIPTGAVAPPASGNVYVVKAGDTLYSIARYYGTTAWAIAQANGLYNLNQIYVGQRLVIPGAAPVAPAATPRPTTPPPATSTAWRGEYYAGKALAGAPVFVRNDAAVNFQWALRSPDTRLNTDQFSARWTRTINFRGGVYRFTIMADDGARIWVDGVLALDAWKIEPGSTHQADVTLTPGYHLITIDYFEDTGSAAIKFTFTRLGNAPVATPTPTVTPTPGGSGTPVAGDGAWVGQYFGNQTLSGTPVITRTDSFIGFEWGQAAPMTGIPSDHFSVRWTRQLWLYEDNYVFCARADDGVRLVVDGKRVIDEWHGSPGYANYCVELELLKGTHTLQAEYYDDGGEALVYVWWERR